MTRHRFLTSTMPPIGAELASRDPADILRWAAEDSRGPAVLTTGLGPSGCILIDLIARHGLRIDIITLDTGLLFAESEAFRRELESRYGVTITRVEPELTVPEQGATHGPELWNRDPDTCCYLRKVRPLTRALAGYDIWITGIRRTQTPLRADAARVEFDPRFDVVKINPILEWSPHDVRRYCETNQVPAHPLRSRGYESIGCRPCTTPVRAGEGAREGRWRGRAKTECGLHAASPDPPVEAPLFPTFLKLTGKTVLIVGGGPVARSKIPPLLEAGAVVNLVAPEVNTGDLDDSVTVFPREFRESDLDGVWFVVAAAPPEVNRRVLAASERRQLFVNAVDDVASASAYAGGVVRRDGVALAISTEGRAPALSRLLREGLQELLPPDLQRWMDAAIGLRPRWRREGLAMTRRTPELLRAINRLYEEDPR